MHLHLAAGGETAIGQVEETATERNEPSHLYPAKCHAAPYFVSLKNDEWGDSDDGFRVSATPRCQR